MNMVDRLSLFQSMSADEIRATLPGLRAAVVATRSQLDAEKAMILALESRLALLAVPMVSRGDVAATTGSCPMDGVTPAGTVGFLAVPDYSLQACIAPVASAECSDFGYVHLDPQQKLPDSDRNTPVYRLLASAGRGCFRCVHDVLQRDGVDVNCPSKSGFTAWDWAEGYGMHEMAQYLAARGGKPSGHDITGWKQRQ
jgi:hypothetical protein